MDKRRKWDEEAIRFLRQHFDKMTDEQIAKALDKTTAAVKKKRQRLELEKDCGRKEYE